MWFNVSVFLKSPVHSTKLLSFAYIHKKNAEALPSNFLYLKFASHYHPNDNYHSYISFAAGEWEEWKRKKVRKTKRGNKGMSDKGIRGEMGDCHIK